MLLPEPTTRVLQDLFREVLAWLPKTRTITLFSQSKFAAHSKYKVFVRHDSAEIRIFVTPFMFKRMGCWREYWWNKVIHNNSNNLLFSVSRVVITRNTFTYKMSASPQDLPILIELLIIIHSNIHSQSLQVTKRKVSQQGWHKHQNQVSWLIS